MIRKEQVHEKYEQARALYMSMMSSPDLKDRFNSERNRLISNYWKSVYVRMAEETDEQIVEKINENMIEILDGWNDWIKTESARVLGKKPSNNVIVISDQEYLVSMGIDPDDSIDRLIDEIRGLIKFD
jgi:hypothetical protein